MGYADESSLEIQAMAHCEFQLKPTGKTIRFNLTHPRLGPTGMTPTFFFEASENVRQAS